MTGGGVALFYEATDGTFSRETEFTEFIVVRSQSVHQAWLFQLSN